MQICGKKTVFKNPPSGDINKVRLTSAYRRFIIDILLPIAEFGQKTKIQRLGWSFGTKGNRRFRGAGKESPQRASWVA